MRAKAIKRNHYARAVTRIAPKRVEVKRRKLLDKAVKKEFRLCH